MKITVQAAGGGNSESILRYLNDNKPTDMSIVVDSQQSTRTDAATILTFVLEVGKDVSVGLVSAYIYDWLKGRASRLQIENSPVAIEQKEIEKKLDH
jgi:hypothetical protein